MASPQATRPTATAHDVARVVEARVRGDGALLLTGMAELDAAGPSELAFLARPEYRALASRTRAGCVIVRSDDELPGRGSRPPQSSPTTRASVRTSTSARWWSWERA